MAKIFKFPSSAGFNQEGFTNAVPDVNGDYSTTTAFVERRAEAIHREFLDKSYAQVDLVRSDDIALITQKSISLLIRDPNYTLPRIAKTQVTSSVRHTGDQGMCELVEDKDMNIPKLIVDGEFPQFIADENTEIDFETARLMAAVYARGLLAVAGSLRSLRRGEFKGTTTRIMKGTSNKYWDCSVAPPFRVYYRAAGTIALNAEVTNCLDFSKRPPYMKHIAGIIDPIPVSVPGKVAQGVFSELAEVLNYH